MEIHHIRSFVTVANVGTVSRAAQQLNIAQPAVSQHIHALERQLGVKLFEREPRGMTPTEAGLALLPHARALLVRVGEMTRAAESLAGSTGRVVEVAATPAMAAALIPGVLSALGPTHDLRVVLYERPTVEALAQLGGRGVQLALVRDCEESGFELELLLEEPLVAAIGDVHPLASKPDLQLADLRSADFVLLRHTGREHLYQAAVAACASVGFFPRTVCEGAEAGTMGHLVVAGLAAAIAPRSLVGLWPGDRIRLIPLPEPAPRSSVFLARLPGHELSGPAETVARAIRRAAAAMTRSGD